MKIKNKEMSLFLVFAKLWKISLIKIGFILPTLKAKMLLRLHECSYGDNLKVCGSVYFQPNGRNTIKLGDNVSITARFLTNIAGITNPARLECIESGVIEIGSNSGMTSAIISSRKSILIGNYVLIGANVRIFDHDAHSTDYLARREPNSDFDNVKSEGIIIENDVFIGTNVIILKGVHIGARSIIAAGSVLTLKNIPPDSLVAGNPARVLKILNVT